LAAMVGVAALAGFSWVALKSVSAVQEMREMIRDVADKLALLPIHDTHEKA
jgi:hypothetical protein